MANEVFLEVNGISFEGFLSVSVSRSIETISGTFNFVATVDSNNSFPFNVGDPVTVKLDQTPVINGYIEKIDVQYGAQAHTITVSGRDKTADIIDSSIDENLTFEGTITLQQIITNVLGSLGITDISVIDESGGIDPFTDKEREAGGIGLPAFEFIEKYARKRQVFLTTDGDGNIVITRASGNAISTELLNELRGASNNILSANCSFDFSQRFNKYIAKSQLNPSIVGNDGTTTDSTALVNQKGEATPDSEIRSTRQLVFNAETSTPSQTAADRATWEANIRRARSVIYQTTVFGFVAQADGLVWQPNYLVKINDQFADVNAQMLIKSVTYNKSLQGTTTTIDFVVKDAYTLQAEQNAVEATANQLGGSFT